MIPSVNSVRRKHTRRTGKFIEEQAQRILGGARSGTTVSSTMRALEIHSGLDVDPVGIGRAVGWGREAALDVVADQKMPIANFELGEARDGVTSNDIQFGAQKIVIAGIDAVTSAWSCCGAAARYPAGVVKTIMCVSQPESMSFDRET